MPNVWRMKTAMGDDSSGHKLYLIGLAVRGSSPAQNADKFDLAGTEGAIVTLPRPRLSLRAKMGRLVDVQRRNQIWSEPDNTKNW
jgi:hypothetical protein